MRRDLVVLVMVLALLASSIACAQFGRRFGRQIHDNDAPPTEFVAMRWHFGTNGAIGHMGWSHNYPESEINLNGFIGRTTRVDVEDNSYRLIELGSPEIFEYPFAYISEPGEMEMTEAEVANLREYVLRGGRPRERRGPDRDHGAAQQRPRELLGMVRQPAVSAASRHRRLSNGHELRRARHDALSSETRGKG